MTKDKILRIDLYLKLMGITKTRMAAKRLCDTGKVRVSEKAVKPSHEILGGETLEVALPQKEMRIRVLDIPFGKSVAKHERAAFIAVEAVKEF